MGKATSVDVHKGLAFALHIDGKDRNMKYLQMCLITLKGVFSLTDRQTDWENRIPCV